MRSNAGMQSTRQSNNNEELGLLIRQQEMMDETKSELNMYHSSSAPPSVEDSMNAVGGISEEELRSDPAYLSCYYENVNMNPMLPKPLVLKEELRYSQGIQGCGGSAIGDWRNWGDGVIGGKVQQICNVDWEDNGVTGLGSRQKSIADMIQNNITRAPSAPKHPSHSTSCSLFDEDVEHSELHYSQLQQELASMDDVHAGANIQGMSATQNIGLSSPHMFSGAVGTSLSRNITPDPQILARIPSPRIASVGGRCNSLSMRNTIGATSVNSVLPVSEPEDLTAALSEISLSVTSVLDEDNHARPRTKRNLNDLPNLFHSQSNSYHIKQYPHFNNSESRQLHLGSVSIPAKGSYGGGVDVDWSNYSLLSDMQAEVHKPAVASINSYLKEPLTPTPSNDGGSLSQYRSIDSPNSPLLNYGLSGYGINPGSPPMLGNQLGSGCFPPLFETVATAKAVGVSDVDSRVMGGLALEPNLIAVAAQLQKRTRVRSLNAGSALQVPHVDPLYLQYLRSNEYAAAQLAALNEQKLNNYMGLLELQKAYLGAFTSSQKSQCGLSYLGDPAGLGPGYIGHPAIGLGLPNLGNPMAGTLLPDFPIGPGTPIMPNDGRLSFPPGIMNLNLVGGSCHPETRSMFHESSASSLLEEFKNNKTRCFELSEIAGHVVEFSGDQYGSRFIQQKIETATTEERIMVFDEIMPKALSLMTDVFGNYVIQKLFELGTTSQVKGLADQLNGHVLALSLQMYGCRVIQKAVEVVSLDQRIKMVAELDGHVTRCVRDQNANHVIQKCIQCIPEYAIQIIVSTFHDQLVTLATHPYGCRVIQRVLENCHDPKTLQIVMDEVLQSVCRLAQDQYGNYVVQHVLEHGTPDERTFMINKFTGKIVEMSYQKYASNVVEKCLAFGTPEERKSIVNEMLVSSDENEPIQGMMKDQFANYVVQKVLETCDDQQLELILEKIKVHLNVLKKYTYGKHIVARVEKLVDAGERRIGALALYSDSISANSSTTAGAAAATTDATNATAAVAI